MKKKKKIITSSSALCKFMSEHSSTVPAEFEIESYILLWIRTWDGIFYLSIAQMKLHSPITNNFNTQPKSSSNFIYVCPFLFLSIQIDAPASTKPTNIALLSASLSFFSWKYTWIHIRIPYEISTFQLNYCSNMQI